MMKNNLADSAPGLLVSVRSASEALQALAGGADVIDIKEPARGSLGAADPSTIAEVVRAVDGRAVVTTALGELTQLEPNLASIEASGMPAPRSSADMFTSNYAHSTMRRTVPPPREHIILMPMGVSLFKIGLADCRQNANWASSWRDAIGHLNGNRNGHASQSRAVAVVYADWPAANSPEPIDVLNAAVHLGCPALLVDTWDKSSGSLFDHWPAAELNIFADDVRSRGIRLVLAGSLSSTTVVEAARLGPDLIAVRTAACEGGRNGAVSRERVQKLKQLLTALNPASSRCGAKEFP